MNLKAIGNRITNNLLNDDFRQSFLIVVLSFLLSVISVVSAIPHYVDDPEKVFAIILTVVFGISVAVLLLTIFVNKYHQIWRRFFMAAILLFFSYLCYDGGPDGFLHIWVLLVPAFSFIVFGLYEGFITAIPNFLALIAFFWWPLADMRKYSEEQAAFSIIDGQVATLSDNFKLRLTLIYLVCIGLGFFAELVRHIVAKRLKVFNENFKYASLHDPLTDLANQNFLAKYLDDVYQSRATNTTLGCLFVDIDSFKNVNDNYGHLFGNVVLVKIAEILSQEKDAFVCRWGGDEFVVCFTNVDESILSRIGEKYRAAISACKFKDAPDLHITVSVGAVAMPVNEDFNFDHVLELADYANRSAKSNGKDNVTLAKK